MRRYLLHGLMSLAGATMALWVVDVGVNIGLLQKLVLHAPTAVTVPDFLGLLLGETQIAFAVVIIAWTLGVVVAAVLRNDDAVKEALVLVQSGLAGLVAMASTRFEWHFSSSQVGQSAAVGGVVGVVMWVGLRWLMSRRKRARWGLGEIVALFTYPSLAAGFISVALARLARHQETLAVVGAIAAAVVIALAFVAFGRRGGVWRVVARWVPLGAMMWIAIQSVVGFRGYGKSDARVEGAGSQRPNIVLIVLDTVRADHLKEYGYSRDTMPALERWAQEGVVFERAVSSAGWTTPSHASMFSGLAISQHGVHSGLAQRDFYTRPFDHVAWLPAELREEGYFTLAVSSNTIAVPQFVGFDTVLSPNRRAWWLTTMAGLADDHVSPLLRRFNENTRWRIPYLDARRIVDIVTRAVPEGDGPIFLFVNFLDAHGPYNPPASALKELGLDPAHPFGRYRSHRTLTRLWKGLPAESGQVLADLYDGELRYLDGELERLLGWIDDRLGQDTIVIVTSDHGEELGEDGRVGHEFGLAQSLIHVPLFVRDGHGTSGRVSDIVSVAAIHDFMFLSALGERPQARTIATQDETSVVSERYPSGTQIRSVGPEYGRVWVAMFENGFKGVGPSEYDLELFDVSENGFSHELEAWDRQVADSLGHRIDAYWTTYKDPRGDDTGEHLSDEELNKLRALGYIK